MESPSDLLSCKRVSEMTSLSRSTIYRKIAASAFPLPVQVTDFRVAWIRSEVEAWVAERPRVAISRRDE